MTFLKPLHTILTHQNNKGKFLNALFVTIWWKVNQLFFHLPAIVEIAPNVKIICYPNNSYGSFIVYAKWPEYEELQFIYSILEAGDSYIDVGAHIGDSSLLAASKIKNGKVIACEPTPTIFNELVANIRLNNFESIITPLQVAVSNEVGSAFFTLETASEVNHLRSSLGKGKSIKVETITVDKMIKNAKLSSLTLLKVDVEGFELEVLQGAKSSLNKDKIEMILFEVNPVSEHITEKVKDIETLLSKSAYTFFRFTEEGKLTEMSELVVPGKTINYLAVSATRKKSSKFKKWLK